MANIVMQKDSDNIKGFLFLYYFGFVKVFYFFSDQKFLKTLKKKPVIAKVIVNKLILRILINFHVFFCKNKN